MKRLLISVVSIMTLSLAACGNGTKEPTTEKDTTNAPTSQPTDSTATDTAGKTESTDQMKTDMDKLSFSEIDVDVSYGKDKEYEAEIEQDLNEPIKAKVEDELNQVFLKGQDAFDDLYPRVQQLQLTKDSTNEETIDQVLKAFELEANYEKFEVEIKFNDGSKLDIEDRK
ncbi:YusW family protein [Sporosarcina obsidiansis]|uniref:YusW family protein n=1 Tax=Sporosarcina obsidiansis TaxID=2660748 RepID=UPI00129BDDD4|nr:YusW family protein [Sporosarcina obsidiansis]